MSDTQWYIEREGVEYGPCTWDGLQALARQGTLRPTDLVRREGDTYFVPAHQARCDAPANPEGAAGQPAAQVAARDRSQADQRAGRARAEGRARGSRGGGPGSRWSGPSRRTCN